MISRLVNPSYLIVISTLLLALCGVSAFAQTAAILPTDIAANDTCYTTNADGSKVPVYDGVAFDLASKMNAFNQSGEIDLTSRQVIYGFSIEEADCALGNVSDISFCFDPVEIFKDTANLPAVYKEKDRARNCGDRKTFTPGQQSAVGQWMFRARSIGQKDTNSTTINGSVLCVEYLSGITWITMGCRTITQPTINVDAQLRELAGSCYVGESCYNSATRHTQNILPFSSVVVQCFQETLHNVFVRETPVTGVCNGRTNLFVYLQDNLRKTITALLTLYVIFFGIKIVLGQEAPEDEEVFVFIIKFVLVVYFALGDGVRDFLYPSFISAAGSLAQMMFDAGGARGLCEFTGYDVGHGNMALWDAFDCRVLFYLGVYNSATVNALITAGGAAAVLSAFTPPVFALLFPLLLGFQILPLAFLIIFCVFLISVGFYVIHTYIMALFGITLLMFISPIFIPLVLFKVTKSYYDAWLKLAISFTLQPMVLFAFLAFMLSVVDTIYYADCSFTDHGITVGGKTFHVFAMDTGGSAACEESFGFRMNGIANDIWNGNGTQTFDAFLFKFKILQPIGAGGDMMGGLFKLCIFLFFFYHIAQMISRLCQELTGSISLRNDGEQAVAIIDDAARAVKNAVLAKAGKMAKGGGGASDKGAGTVKRKL